jgi:hypothetical protein
VLQAGKAPLTLDEIVRLHNVLIEDRRLVRAGLRPDGIFLGERDTREIPYLNSLERARRISLI